MEHEGPIQLTTPVPSVLARRRIGRVGLPDISPIDSDKAERLTTEKLRLTEALRVSGAHYDSSSLSQCVAVIEYMIVEGSVWRMHPGAIDHVYQLLDDRCPVVSRSDEAILIGYLAATADETELALAADISNYVAESIGLSSEALWNVSITPRSSAS